MHCVPFQIQINTTFDVVWHGNIRQKSMHCSLITKSDLATSSVQWVFWIFTLWCAVSQLRQISTSAYPRQLGKKKKILEHDWHDSHSVESGIAFSATVYLVNNELKASTFNQTWKEKFTTHGGRRWVIQLSFACTCSSNSFSDYTESWTLMTFAVFLFRVIENCKSAPSETSLQHTRQQWLQLPCRTADSNSSNTNLIHLTGDPWTTLPQDEKGTNLTSILTATVTLLLLWTTFWRTKEWFIFSMTKELF